MTIDRWIVETAARTAQKPALIFDDQTISYSDFTDRIATRADELSAAGIGHGDRVAWYGYNHPEVFILLFACARLGSIFVPLNWRLAEPEVAAIVADCGPKLVVYGEQFADRARNLPDTTTIALGNAIPSSQEAASSGKASENDALLIVYTSGSTGEPKGAVLTQKALTCNAKMSVEAHGMSAGDTVLNVLPLFHVGGLNIMPTPAFSIGASVVLHEVFDVDATCEALQGVQFAIMVPTVLQAVMASSEWQDADFSKLKGLSIGSTDVPVALIEAVHGRGVPLIQVYGATETAPFAIYQSVDEAYETVGSIGRAGSGCQIRLVSEGVDVADGEAGEIWVKGDNVLREYWRAPQLTAELLQDGWFRTGDVATRDESGLFWFADRIKHVIISGGENIYPAEIERILRDLPDVEEVAVVGRSDPKWGEIPVAVVVARGDLSTQTVLGSLKGRLASYKRPKDVVFVDALPRNSMGKVVAAEVRAMIA